MLTTLLNTVARLARKPATCPSRGRFVGRARVRDARYHTDNRLAGSQQNLTTTYKTMLSLYGVTATLCRGRLVGIAVGADGPPNATDCQIVYAVQRQSTSGGTRVAGTPNPNVPGDVASRTGNGLNYTAEGTYTLPIWSRVLNQRASMQWVAQDTDAMLLWPATNDVGVVGLALSPTYASPALIGFDYEDQ